MLMTTLYISYYCTLYTALSSRGRQQQQQWVWWFVCFGGGCWSCCYIVQIGMGNKVPRHAFCSFSNQIMEATKDVLFYAYLTLSVAPLLPATPHPPLLSEKSQTSVPHQSQQWQQQQSTIQPTPQDHSTRVDRHPPTTTGWGVLRCLVLFHLRSYRREQTRFSCVFVSLCVFFVILYSVMCVCVFIEEGAFIEMCVVRILNRIIRGDMDGEGKVAISVIILLIYTFIWSENGEPEWICACQAAGPWLLVGCLGETELYCFRRRNWTGIWVRICYTII